MIIKKVEYINSYTKVIIICKTHGLLFQQSPANHLSKHIGCSKCVGRVSNTQEFIETAIKVHGNKYEYNKVKYENCYKKVIIICKMHGNFKQIPNSHLSGSGCSKCTKKHSKPQILWLDLVSKLNNTYIQHAMNDGEFKIPGTKYLADGYCEKTNTIYEFHGDYWHGNPNVFGSNDMNKTCSKTHGELYKQTLKKEKLIRDLGYNLVVMWESDWHRINYSIKTLQLKFRRV